MSSKIRKLGTVHALSKSGYAVVRLEGKHVRVGVKALWKGEELGTVTDLIGNIESPYALVKLANKGMLSEVQVGDEVYYLAQPPRKRGRGRPGRRREKRRRGGKGEKRGRMSRRVLLHGRGHSMQKHGRGSKR